MSVREMLKRGEFDKLGAQKAEVQATPEKEEAMPYENGFMLKTKDRQVRMDKSERARYLRRQLKQIKRAKHQRGYSKSKN